MTTYARIYRGRVTHLVRGTASTLCGKPLAGMAQWTPEFARRVNMAPTCGACRTATRESCPPFAKNYPVRATGDICPINPSKEGT